MTIQGPPHEGYVSQLPPGAQALVDQERDRIMRLLTALCVDLGVSLADPVLVLLGDLDSKVGAVLARAFMSPEEIRLELASAKAACRRPVILEALVKDQATEFVERCCPLIRGYVALKRGRPSSFVLLVAPCNEAASITMAAPVVRAPTPGLVN